MRAAATNNAPLAGATIEKRIDELNSSLRPSFNRNRSGWITSTVLDGRPVLRVTIMNPRTGPEHLKVLLDGLAEEATRLIAAPV